jgi:hypothetical protein
VAKIASAQENSQPFFFFFALQRTAENCKQKRDFFFSKFLCGCFVAGKFQGLDPETLLRLSGSGGGDIEMSIFEEWRDGIVAEFFSRDDGFLSQDILLEHLDLPRHALNIHVRAFTLPPLLPNATIATDHPSFRPCGIYIP